MAGTKLSRFRMFGCILCRSFIVRRRRVAIAFFSVLIGAAVITALLSVYLDISIKMSRELRAYGANLFLGAVRAGSKTFPLNGDIYQRVLAEIPAERLVGASPYLYGVVRLGPGEAVMAGGSFVGLRKLFPHWQVEGSWVALDFDLRHAMVGKSLADKTGIKVGDTVTLMNTETELKQGLTVKGIIETGQAEDEQILVNLPLAQKILGIPGQINHALFSIVADGLDMDALATRVEDRFAGVVVRPIRQVSYSEGKVLDKISGLMAFVAVVILALTSLCVMTSLMAMVVERSTEIGLMKALGADDGSIRMLFWSEAVLICLAGAAAGMLVGFVLAQILGQAVFGSAISLRLGVLPVTILISLAAALVAAALPVRMAVRVVPARVLKGGE